LKINASAALKIKNSSGIAQSVGRAPAIVIESIVTPLCPWERRLWPYSKSKLELESNLSEILSVNYKFIRGSSPTCEAW